MAFIDSVVTFEGSEAGFFLNQIITEPTIVNLGWQVIVNQEDKYIYFHTSPNKITRAKTDCGSTEANAGMDVTRKLLNYVEMQAFDAVCYKKFDNTIFAKLRKTGINKADLSGTQMEDVIMTIFKEIIGRDMLRILLLSDTAYGDVDYNIIDGWYKKLSGSTAATIGAIADSDLTAANILPNVFREAYEAQGRRLKQVPVGDKAYYVTRTIYDAYQAFFELQDGLESNKAGIVNGTLPTSYRGVQIIPLDIVDEFNDADFQTSPVGGNDPHRLVLAKKDQTFVGLDSNNAGTELEVWYDKDTEKNKYRSTYNLDIQIGYDELFVIGGF